jgi:ABC-type transport system involved in cytochrome c biogenesis permease component
MLLAQELLKAMGRFGQKIVNESNVIKFMLPWNGEIPPHRLLAPPVIAVDPPVYGHFNPDYREFTTPGFMLGIIYIVAVGMTAISLVQERKDGILERSLVAGVRSIHIILAHVWIQFCMVFLQGVFLFLVLFQLFMITVNGSTIHAFFLLILQGAAGMSMGE